MSLGPPICTDCKKMMIYGHRGEPRGVQEQRDEIKYWWCYGCGKDIDEVGDQVKYLSDLGEEEMDDLVDDPAMVDVFRRLGYVPPRKKKNALQSDINS